MCDDRAVDPLDNPVWHTLTGPQVNVAEGAGLARRFHPDFSVFAALPDHPTTHAWAELASLVGADRTALLVPRYEPPAGWSRLGTFAVHQMVAASPVAPHPPDGLTELGVGDAAAMTALVEHARPGPWAARTHELGSFIGIRTAGRLVAMVGQRMRLPGAVEISAVCTDEQHRGRGLAAALTALMAARVAATGRTPFLHVMEDNTAAVRAYERAGFRIRATLHPGAYQAPA